MEELERKEGREPKKENEKEVESLKERKNGIDWCTDHKGKKKEKRKKESRKRKKKKERMKEK